MPDDDRKRRRLGDATKSRIAELEDGWTVDPADVEPADDAEDDETDDPGDHEASAAPRPKSKSQPPPPPGSTKRKALVIESGDTPAPPPRPKPPSVPPPIPPRKPTHQVQTLNAKSGPADVQNASASGVIEEPNRASQGIIDPTKSVVIKSELELDEIGPPIFDQAKIKAGPSKSSLPKLDLGNAASSRPVFPLPAEPPPRGSPPPTSQSRPAPAASRPAPAASQSRLAPAASQSRASPPPASQSRSSPPPALRPPSPRSTIADDVMETIPELGPHGASRLALPADDSGVVVAPGDPRFVGPGDARLASDDSGVVIPPRMPPSGSRLPPGNSWVGPLGHAVEPVSDPRLAVPVGEFDVGAATTIEEGKRKIAHQQATIVRDAANALLNIAESTSMRGDATTVDGSTNRFERGDPTTTTGAGTNALADVSSPRMTQSVGTIRSLAALRRKRGIGGDVRYVYTAMMGVRTARRELAELEARQATRQTSRRHHLLTLGRAAVTNETHDHPALTRARELLGGVEDDRARNAGLVMAADLELDRVRRDRDAAAKKFLVDAGAADTELAELAKKLEPLDKEAAAVRRRATALQESLKRIEKKIADTESRLHSPKLDRAAVQADIATLKADRVAVKRDEPVIADELDALAPRIAAIEATRADAERRRRDLDKEELDDQRRSEELLAAIGAKRKVVERAAADAEVERDKILFELGERLYVDRPRSLKAQLAPVEEIDLEVGVGDRRIMELRELIGSIDKAKLARGIAVIVLAAAAVISLVTLVVVKIV